MEGHGNSEGYEGLKEANFQWGGGTQKVFFPEGFKFDGINTIILFQ